MRSWLRGIDLSVLDKVQPLHIVGLAMAIRLVWLAVCPNEPVSDQVVYDFSARAIAEGKGYVDVDGDPANYWPVGYAAVLGAVYWLLGTHYWAGYLLNVIMWGGAAYFAFRIAGFLYGMRAGVVAGLVFALYPGFVLQATLLASETPFILGSLIYIYGLLRTANRAGPFILSALALGVLLGALVYVRPPALLLAALPFVLLLFRRAQFVRAVAFAGSVSIAMLLTLVPWGARNQAHFDRFELISTNGGPNLWMGNHPGADGGYVPLPKDVEHLSLGERDRVLRERAVHFIRSEPLQYLILCVKRIGMSLRSDTSSVVWNEIGIKKNFGLSGFNALRILCTLAHYVLLASVLSALLYRRNDLNLEREGTLSLTILLLAVPFVLIVGGNRYAMPLIPIFVIFATSLTRKPLSEAL